MNIKRVSLTSLACFVTAILPLTISTGEMFYTFSVPLLFSLAILMTNLDRVTTKTKYHAIVLSVILTTILFFIYVPLGFFLGQSFLGQYYIYAICIISGLLLLLINSIFIHIDNFKLGLLVTALLALTIPPLTKFLKGLKILNIEFFGDPATFFIVWQTVVGLALAISIWTRTKEKTPATNNYPFIASGERTMNAAKRIMNNFEKK